MKITLLWELESEDNKNLIFLDKAFHNVTYNILYVIWNTITKFLDFKKLFYAPLEISPGSIHTTDTFLLFIILIGSN